MSKFLSSLSAALLLAATLPAGVHAAPQGYVVMGTPLVNLRTGPSTNAMVLGRAEKGDIFRVLGQSDEWYRILMFSGEARYVTKSDFVYPLRKDQLVDGHGMSLPISTARCRSIFWDTEEGLDRAAREALEIIPATLNRERYTVLKKILEDRILLEMFHIHGIQPALYRELVAEARREGWN
ncbi:MAG: SH3 domain-containing protein [Gemmatimonadota bacterium]